MAFAVADSVWESSTDSGSTASYNLSGALVGYKTFFSTIGTGNTCYYAIVNRSVTTEWEIGLGTISGTSGTGILTRTSILSSSTGSLVSFSSGTKDIFCTYPASTSVYLDEFSNLALDASNDVIVGTSNLPQIKPSLNLDFANGKQLDPRITFSRNTVATYYDGKSVAKAEENLFKYSQDFNTSAWNKNNCTINSITETAPDLTSTASLITFTALYGFLLYPSIAVTAGLVYTFSFWAKAGTNNNLLHAWIDNPNESGLGTFTPTTSWVRYSFPFTNSTTGNRGFRVQDRNSANWGSIYIWGAQLEQRSSVTAYTPTTSSPITNYIPVLKTAPANVPRFDYDPITKKPLGLLIEEGRTNLLTYSSNFSNAVWVVESGALNSPNTIIAPDGTLTGCKLYADATNIQHTLRQGVVTTAITYTYSIYAKAGEKRRLVLRDNQVGREGTFDLISGTIVSNLVNGEIITYVGNGWYRCSITGTFAAATTRLQVLVADNKATSYATAAFLGDGYSGIYIWGAQLEAGSFATSYIPTAGTALSRAADSASMSGVNFSSWYNQNEGSIYTEIDTYVIGTISGGASTICSFYLDNNNLISYTIRGNQMPIIYTNAALQVDINFGALFNTNTFYRFAGCYALNNILSSINGGTCLIDTTVTLPNGLTAFKIGTAWNNSLYLNGHIKKLTYYPKALTAVELKGLTS